MHRTNAILFTTLAACLGIATICYGQGAEATKQHEVLKRDVGQWSAQMKIWMQPDAEPIQFPATETNSMVGDLWVLTSFDAGPFKGHGQLGYDTRKKKYVGTWIDNMTDHLAVMEGEHNEATGETTMYATTVSPTTGKVEKTKSITKFDGDDAKLMTMFNETEDGNWRKSFEISYRRVKK